MILTLGAGIFSWLSEQTFQTFIQHFVLRFVLYRNHYIPWNYVRFLNYATDRLFLRKVGGGYIFVHQLLLEHFAELDESQQGVLVRRILSSKGD